MIPTLIFTATHSDPEPSLRVNTGQQDMNTHSPNLRQIQPKPIHQLDSRHHHWSIQSTLSSAFRRTRDDGGNRLKQAHHKGKRLIDSVRRVSDDDSDDSWSNDDSRKSQTSSLKQSLLSRVDGLTRLTSDYLLSSSEEESESWWGGGTKYKLHTLVDVDYEVCDLIWLTYEGGR